ncbi:hypothetical protein GOP47_0024629 [Adiantum capillus-veneris]|uniref:Uncharacterized protein n=1 Tax=Adiantum capillus-veneris TaxID=13818 RepID=A0A9D4U4E4_ADICA|nr:hypothetical protein GOP47_0024629 [Adiantum capillus-veneris]
MSDSIGILSKLGYKNMWCKLKDYRSKKGERKPALPAKVLVVACEKRVPSGGKIWIGGFGTMAMAAHGFDLVAEAFGWSERHYETSELLLSRAAELRKDLGDNFDIEKNEVRRKISAHAFKYASLFPCSDSKQTLTRFFKVWGGGKGAGRRCQILVEIPRIAGQDDDHYYPRDLLPPVTIPESTKTKGQTLDEDLERLTKKRKEPRCVLGTRDIQDEMDVEPDSVGCIIVDDPGSGFPSFHQQWTWCTRRKRETRPWIPPRVPYPPRGQFPSFPDTTFFETPSFVTGPKDQRPFSFLNFQIYHNINHSKRKLEYAACEWKGTSMDKFEPSEVPPVSCYVEVEVI